MYSLDKQRNGRPLQLYVRVKVFCYINNHWHDVCFIAFLHYASFDSRNLLAEVYEQFLHIIGFQLDSFISIREGQTILLFPIMSGSNPGLKFGFKIIPTMPGLIYKSAVRKDQQWHFFMCILEGNKTKQPPMCTLCCMHMLYSFQYEI